MTTSERMANYMLCIHTVKYHAAFKMRKSLSYIIIYMNTDDTVLNKTRQTHKVKSCMIPVNGVVIITETGATMVVKDRRKSSAV